MAFFRQFLIVTLVSLFILDSEAKIITLINKCNTTIWPGLQVLLARQESEFMKGGFELQPEQSMNITTPPLWEFFIWARTGCSFDSSGNGGCITGDCGENVRCSLQNQFPNPPFTMVTISLGQESDVYGVYLGSGFNVPISISPNGPGSDKYNSSSCTSDLTKNCPEELKVTFNGQVVACTSPCLAFNTPEFCCSDSDGQNNCKATKYTKVFKDLCPAATADNSEQNSNMCSGISQYLVSFCG
ncbi:pathogenesis-related thaumatin-like protein 3.5 [Mercurialis annua]|uniref:pathogenesis-related thaumatin-like protein 3.5 n=1 Tax=Mercurialis annua TaxID=3986 RepID=UPI00215F2752|nr:pathogenesis-related thaumatin-like protein 3.5 [Mercurialis annua]